MLMTIGHDWTLRTVVSMVAKGQIRALPGLSYGAMWDRARMSRFVEDALSGVPLGLICVIGGSRGPVGILDGLRRVTALCLYAGVVPPWSDGAESGFAIEGASFDPSLEGATYETLGARLEAFDNGVVAPGGL